MFGKLQFRCFKWISFAFDVYVHLIKRIIINIRCNTRNLCAYLRWGIILFSSSMPPYGTGHVTMSLSKSTSWGKELFIMHDITGFISSGWIFALQLKNMYISFLRLYVLQYLNRWLSGYNIINKTSLQLNILRLSWYCAKLHHAENFSRFETRRKNVAILNYHVHL